jgi:hypothetical protein
MIRMRSTSDTTSRASKRVLTARSLPFFAALVVPGLFASNARANSAMPHTIDTTVDGNSVKVCEYKICADPADFPRQHRILRHDVATGEVVVVPLHCADGCVVDECVPPGDYHYGEVFPWYGDCHPIAAAKVTAPLAATCAPTLGPERPTKSAEEAPWGDDPEPRSCGGGYGCLRCAAPGLSDADSHLPGAGAITLLMSLLLLARRPRRRR